MSISTIASHARMQGLSNWAFDRLSSHSASKYGLRVNVVQFGSEATTSGYQSLARAREVKLVSMGGSNGFDALAKSQVDYDLCVSDIGSSGLVFSRGEHLLVTDGKWYGPVFAQQTEVIERFKSRQRMDRTFGVIIVAVGPLRSCNLPLLKSVTLRRPLFHLTGDRFDPIFEFLAKLGRTVSESAPGEDLDLPSVDGICEID